MKTIAAALSLSLIATTVFAQERPERAKIDGARILYNAGKGAVDICTSKSNPQEGVADAIDKLVENMTDQIKKGEILPSNIEKALDSYLSLPRYRGYILEMRNKATAQGWNLNDPIRRLGLNVAMLAEINVRDDLVIAGVTNVNEFCASKGKRGLRVPGMPI